VIGMGDLLPLLPHILSLDFETELVFSWDSILIELPKEIACEWSGLR